MRGLESRLQRVDGVAGIELELGTNGLEGINVRLEDGADESVVLESVRRLLVAYGTKPPRGSAVYAGEPAGSGSGETETETVIDLDRLEAQDEPTERFSSARILLDDGEVELAVGPSVDGAAATVVLTRGKKVVRRQIPSSARAIVQAVIDAGAEVSDLEPISVMGINLSRVENSRILTVIVGDHGSSPRVSTTSVVREDWPRALLDILAQVLEARTSMGATPR